MLNAYSIIEKNLKDIGLYMNSKKTDIIFIGDPIEREPNQKNENPSDTEDITHYLILLIILTIESICIHEKQIKLVEETYYDDDEKVSILQDLQNDLSNSENAIIARYSELDEFEEYESEYAYIRKQIKLVEETYLMMMMKKFQFYKITK